MDDDQRLPLPTPMDIAENLAIVGVGFANAPTKNTFAVNLFNPVCVSISYQNNFNIYSIRFIHDDETNADQFPDDIVYDIGLLYGVGYHDPGILVSISAGLEYINETLPFYNLIVPSSNPANNPPITLSEETATTTSAALGIAYQVQILGSFTKNVGMGLIMFGDVNKIFSQFGLLLCLQFGEL